MRSHEVADDFDHAVTNPFQRGEVPHVNPGQALRQFRFIARRQAPVSKIVGESLSDKVMFLQGAEGMLKDAIFRAGLHGSQQLREVVSLVAADPQQVL